MYNAPTEVSKTLPKCFHTQQNCIDQNNRLLKCDKKFVLTDDVLTSRNRACSICSLISPLTRVEIFAKCIDTRSHLSPT